MSKPNFSKSPVNLKKATSQMAQVLDLVDASAKSHPDGLKALAYELKREATKAESTLRAELNQTAGHCIVSKESGQI